MAVVNDAALRKRRDWQRFASRWKQYGIGYLFLLPWAVGFVACMAYPLGWSLYTSFTKVTFAGTGFEYKWVGMANYKYAFTEDNEYSIQLLHFIQEMILMIPIIVLFAFFVAIFLNQPFRGRFLFRSIFFLPVIFATGQVLMELFSQGAGKPPFLGEYGVDQLVDTYVIKQFQQTVKDVLGLIVIILWYSGVQILLFIAGFQTIARSVYEAVQIDGASPWESFWKITLPAMKPFITLNILYTIVDLFTFPLNPVMAQMQKNMFLPETGYGYTSALGWSYFAIVLALIGIVLAVAGLSARRKRIGV